MATNNTEKNTNGNDVGPGQGFLMEVAVGEHIAEQQLKESSDANNKKN